MRSPTIEIKEILDYTTLKPGSDLLIAWSALTVVSPCPESFNGRTRNGSPIQIIAFLEYRFDPPVR